MSFYQRQMAARLKQIKKQNVATPTPTPTPTPKKSHITVASSKIKITPEYASEVCAVSYLGKKGYTIPKSALSPEDLVEIKKELYMRPTINGKPDPDVAFPVYRENDAKIYLPRFYGISRYGLPPRSEIDPGEDIDVPFVKELRDYQNNIIDIYVKHADQPIHSLPPGYSGEAVFGGGAILEVPCGRGKTVMALKIISVLAKKTLILVHKEFLMNQWIERISEFVPSAKVGKIQGPVFDVEGKDIVIGMIQTLYDKDYSPEVFSVFGLTVIDEVHRIGSEQFSRTLLKIITPYMLGISATVERKDGLTKVLNYFIGDKIYSEEREHDDPVCVRAIEYITKDADHMEVEYDFRGQVKHSTMLSKLSNYAPRSDFLSRILSDLVAEHPRNQIMVLAHQRALLTYLFEAVQNMQIAGGSVGYYVGGMKESALKETEEKRIVLATYAMAAEALDIKSLSTLVMVTPKTDIIQSVGRILRTKHENPIVVDVVDKHDVFQKQWFQRRRFYKKCGYRIRQIDSTKYEGFKLDWKTDKTWRWVHEPAGFNNGCNPENMENKDNSSGEEDEDQPKIKGCMININLEEYKDNAL